MSPRTHVPEKRARYILGECEELYKDAYDCFREKANRILEAASFYRGKQYVLLQRRDGEERLVADPRGEMAEVVNFCRPIVTASASKKLKQIPNPRIAAAKDDQEAEARARFTEKIGLAFAHNGTIDYDEAIRTVIWSTATGMAFMGVLWDPMGGRILASEESGMEGEDEPDPESPEDERLLDPFGFPISSLQYQGGIRTLFVPPTEGFPDPSIKSSQDMKRPGAYFVHEQQMTVRELANEYPVDYFGKPTGRRFMPPEDDGKHASAWRPDDELNDYRFTSSEGNVVCSKRSLWMMPNNKYKNGMLFVHSGATILYCGPHPYWPRRLPFVPFYGDNMNPTGFFPDGLLRDIISMQRTTNHVESRKVEIINKMGNPHLLVPRGSGITANSWGNMPGQIVNYLRPHKPEVMQGADVPPSMFQHSNEQFDRAKFLTGVTDLSSGDVPADISGRSIVFATQNSDEQKAIVTLLHRQSMLTVMQHCVYHARQRFDEGRLIETVGENEMPEAIAWASDKFDWENDFLPEIFSDEPSTHAAKISEIIELAGAQFYAEGLPAERMRKAAAQSGAIRHTWDPFAADRKNAQREQLAFIENPLNLPQVSSYDNHAIHGEEHDVFRKSAQYKKLPQFARARFDRHCDNHSLLLKFGGGPLDASPENAANTATLGAMAAAGQSPPGPPGAPPGVESPPDGGHADSPAAPPSIQQFASMSDGEQRASDQQ